MCLETKPMLHWSEVALVLSSTDTFKACALGGLRFDENHLRETWIKSRYDKGLRAELQSGSAFGLHLLLAEVRYDALFSYPSPFIAKHDP